MSEAYFRLSKKNNDKRSGMSGKDRKDWLKAQLKSELYKELMPYAEPDSRLVKIMANRLKRRKYRRASFRGQIYCGGQKKLPVAVFGA
mgnify:CR=1 FL=1